MSTFKTYMPFYVFYGSIIKPNIHALLAFRVQ
jgi:hypothetical protein